MKRLAAPFAGMPLGWPAIIAVIVILVTSVASTAPAQTGGSGGGGGAASGGSGGGPTSGTGTATSNLDSASRRFGPSGGLGGDQNSGTFGTGRTGTFGSPARGSGYQGFGLQDSRTGQGGATGGGQLGSGQFSGGQSGTSRSFGFGDARQSADGARSTGGSFDDRSFNSRSFDDRSFNGSSFDDRTFSGGGFNDGSRNDGTLNDGGLGGEAYGRGYGSSAAAGDRFGADMTPSPARPFYTRPYDAGRWNRDAATQRRRATALIDDTQASGILGRPAGVSRRPGDVERQTGDTYSRTWRQSRVSQNPDMSRETRDAIRFSPEDMRGSYRDAIGGFRDTTRQTTRDIRDTSDNLRDARRVRARDTAEATRLRDRDRVLQGANDTYREQSDRNADLDRPDGDAVEQYRGTSRRWQELNGERTSPVDVQNLRAADLGLRLAPPSGFGGGLTITDVGTARGAMARAGFRAGDRIVSVGGQRVGRENELLQNLFADPSGAGTVQVEVLRDGQRRFLSVYPDQVLSGPRVGTRVFERRPFDSSTYPTR